MQEQYPLIKQYLLNLYNRMMGMLRSSDQVYLGLALLRLLIVVLLMVGYNLLNHKELKNKNTKVGYMDHIPTIAGESGAVL